MPDVDSVLEVLRTELKNVVAAVHEMRTEVQGMSARLERIAIIEERHNSQAKALERAFNSITELEKGHEEHLKDAVNHRNRYDRAIWMTSGAAAAVSIFWTIFGVYLTDAVRENSRITQQASYHMANDKMTNAEDVRSVCRTEHSKP